MIKSFKGISPVVPASSFVSVTALIMGDVVLGEYVGIWPGAIIRGDVKQIKVGDYTIIEDNCVVHSGTTLELGSQVVVGHGAVIHCRRIGNNTLIGNNATILDDAEVGSYCVIGAGCVVSPGSKIPEGSLVYGVPGKVVGPVKSHHLEWLESGSLYYVEMFEQYRKDGI